MLQKIRELIRIAAKLDHLPQTDREYYIIINAISERTSKHTELNINTLKSIFDHWKTGSRELSKTTKETISDFLGFDNWDDLVTNIDVNYKLSIKYNCLLCKRNVSELGTNDYNNKIMSLEKGREIIIKYLPDREIRIQVLNNNRYKVISSRNSSLNKDDEITIKSFQPGIEFAAFDIKRRGSYMGNYTAASGHVIYEIKIL